MGCTVTVPQGGGPSFMSKRRVSRRSEGADASTNGDGEAGLLTRASSANITEDRGDEGNHKRNLILDDTDRQASFSSHEEVDDLDKTPGLDEPYLTEDILQEFADRSSRSSGSTEEFVMRWVSQIPKGPLEIDPLERHQASMAELKELQEQKRRERSQAPGKSKKKSSHR